MDCIPVSSGPEAWAAIRREPPAAAVLDVNMPDMDGYELLSAIRGAKLAIPVLLLTARQGEKDVIRAFSLGADDYMVKPFSPLELAARLKRLLRK
jgi:DNA-binding response OmpR family regulator